VRRLLENGANSSFVALAADESVPVATLLRRPAEIIGTTDRARHPNIPLPRDLYGPQRKNARGIEFGERAALNKLAADIAAAAVPSARTDDTTPADANAAIAAAREGFRRWSRTPADARAKILETAADLLEQRARISLRCCSARAARPLTMRSPRCARLPIFAATTPRKEKSVRR